MSDLLSCPSTKQYSIPDSFGANAGRSYVGIGIWVHTDKRIVAVPVKTTAYVPYDANLPETYAKAVCPEEVVQITTLESEPFVLTRDIPVVVSPMEDGYLATFSAANIEMIGDTKEEAVANLRLLLVDMFDDFEVQESHLGPHPQRQLAALRAFIHRRP